MSDTHDKSHGHDDHGHDDHGHGDDAHSGGAHGGGAHDGHGDDYWVHSHVASWKFYAGIFAVLIFFTLLTVGISRIHLGPLNLAVAVVIASMKATLVVLFFMHLKYDNKFNGIIFVSTLMFIGVFFAYTINDTAHRGEIDESQGTYIDRASGKEAPGGLTPMPKALGSSNTAVEGAPKVDHVDHH